MQRKKVYHETTSENDYRTVEIKNQDKLKKTYGDCDT